ncbi:recombinase family protein [Oscillospiraceae bacterium PP1C4]
MNTTVAYARVSTDGQCLNRQLDSLKAYGVEQIFAEKITGTTVDRPELNRLKSILRAGDVVVVESLSRLGRSTKDLACSILTSIL